MGEALNKIIQSCFEGFFGTMVAGWLFYTMQSIRKNRRMLIWLWVMLFAMAIWRFFIPNFYSPRYAVIFIFPAILLTAYMMVKFKKLCWVLLIVLGIICCCKILRPNLTGRMLIDASDVIRKDAADKKHPLVIVDDKDGPRMEFYSSLPVLPFDESKNFPVKLLDLSRIISNNANQSDAVYICCEIPANLEITKENLNLDGDFKLIYSTLSNRRKKIYFNVYRYLKNGNISPVIMPEGKNLIANGNFEKSRIVPEKLLNILSKRKHKFFTENIQLPFSWSINTNHPEFNVEIEASAVNPLSGKRSLRLKNPSNHCGVYSNLFTVRDKAEFYCRIRGKVNSIAKISLLCYESRRSRPVVIPLLPVKILFDDRITEHSFSFDPEKYGVKGQYFRISLQVDSGEVFFDDVIVADKK